jgi:putative cardiolipin synthase
LSPGAGANKRVGLEGSAGSSASSLHAKTLSVDGSHVFIGSFNFDLRSAKLNTEMGFVIDSPALAQKISAVFDSRIPANAYQVRLSDTGQLYWTECRAGKLMWHDTDPGTSLWQRAGIWFMSALPIE